MVEDRIRCKALLGKVMSSADAALSIHDSMMVGASGFTRAGDVKAVPAALAERVQREGQSLRVTLVTGASLGHDTDKILTQAGVLARRLPFQVDSTLRRAINDGQVMYVDQHLSETVKLLRTNRLGWFGGHTPHNVATAFGLHTRFAETGTMRL
jgi:succinyl-CoA:acetate CoA-transferase